jgi:cold shock CspA family protein
MQAIRFITTSKAPFPIKKLPRSSSILTPSSFFSTDSSSSSSSPTSSTTTTTASNENRVIGSVKFYQNRKSFGFIKSDVDDSEYFVHRVNIRGAPSNDVANPILKVGEKVSFEKIARNDGKEGFQADDIIYEDGTNIPVYREGVRTYCSYDSCMNILMHNVASD